VKTHEALELQQQDAGSPAKGAQPPAKRRLCAAAILARLPAREVKKTRKRLLTDGIVQLDDAVWELRAGDEF